jgi:hypothetical protein
MNLRPIRALYLLEPSDWLPAAIRAIDVRVPDAPHQ